MKKFLWGVVLGLVVAGILGATVPLAVLLSGGLNVAASSGPWPLEETLAPRIRDASIARRAPTTTNPLADDESAAASGLSLYFEDCVLCHAIPGTAEAEYTGLYPPAPRLDLPQTQQRTDGELFWILDNGLKMTGMPAFRGEYAEEEIWEVVAFLRELPEMVEETPPNEE